MLDDNYILDTDIKVKAYLEFLKRLVDTKTGECVDMVSDPGFSGLINVDKLLEK